MSVSAHSSFLSGKWKWPTSVALANHVPCVRQEEIVKKHWSSQSEAEGHQHPWHISLSRHLTSIVKLQFCTSFICKISRHSQTKRGTWELKSHQGVTCYPLVDYSQASNFPTKNMKDFFWGWVSMWSQKCYMSLLEKQNGATSMENRVVSPQIRKQDPCYDFICSSQNSCLRLSPWWKLCHY